MNSVRAFVFVIDIVMSCGSKVVLGTNNSKVVVDVSYRNIIAVFSSILMNRKGVRGLREARIVCVMH
jgi:hypothetical protein